MSQVLLVQPRTEDWQSGRVLHLSIRAIDTTDLYYHYTKMRLIVVITLEAAIVFFKIMTILQTGTFLPTLAFRRIVPSSFLGDCNFIHQIPFTLCLEELDLDS